MLIHYPLDIQEMPLDFPTTPPPPEQSETCTERDNLHLTSENSDTHNYLTKLPPEIFLVILEYLPYPDALSLSSSDVRLSKLITPTLTITSRVEWLVSRAEQGLRVPQLQNLNLRSDAAFVRNGEVRSIIRQRRLYHADCRAIVEAQLMKQLLDEHVNLLFDTLDLRCRIVPTAGPCHGILTAESIMAFDSYAWTADRERSYVFRVSRTRKVLSWMLGFANDFLLKPVLAVGAGIVHLNHQRLKIMFKLWTWFEGLVAVALLMHFGFGIDLGMLIGSLGENLVNLRTV